MIPNGSRSGTAPGSEKCSTSTESQICQGWKGPLEIPSPTPLARQGHLEQLTQEHVQVGTQSHSRTFTHPPPSQKPQKPKSPARGTPAAPPGDSARERAGVLTFLSLYSSSTWPASLRCCSQADTSRRRDEFSSGWVSDEGSLGRRMENCMQVFSSESCWKQGTTNHSAAAARDSSTEQGNLCMLCVGLNTEELHLGRFYCWFF